MRAQHEGALLPAAGPAKSRPVEDETAPLYPPVSDTCLPALPGRPSSYGPMPAMPSWISSPGSTARPSRTIRARRRRPPPPGPWPPGPRWQRGACRTAGRSLAARWPGWPSTGGCPATRTRLRRRRRLRGRRPRPAAARPQGHASAPQVTTGPAAGRCKLPLQAVHGYPWPPGNPGRNIRRGARGASRILTSVHYRERRRCSLLHEVTRCGRDADGAGEVAWQRSGYAFGRADL